MLAVLRTICADPGMAERHHRHHDTYTVSHFLSRTLIMILSFMSVLGVVLTLLCELGIFDVEWAVVVAFFLAFDVVLFAIWASMTRYRVVTYADHMVVTPFVGPTRTVDYKDIERMSWTRPNSLAGYQSVRVYVKGHTGAVTIWGTIDVEQILIRINRYDVLESYATEV